jgi:hypothetical protein
MSSLNINRNETKAASATIPILGNQIICKQGRDQIRLHWECCPIAVRTQNRRTLVSVGRASQTSLAGAAVKRVLEGSWKSILREFSDGGYDVCGSRAGWMELSLWEF